MMTSMMLDLPGLLMRGAETAAELWEERSRLTGSAWANEHGWIARGSGASESGPYSTDRTPYMAEILDVICDEEHQDVVFNKPAQVGFTEVLNQAVGYAMAYDPSGILVIQPSDKLAKAWMKERIDPLVAESPVLRGLVRSEGGRRTSDDTMERKVFRGGSLIAIGANAPNNLRSRAMRRVYADERSGWVLDARNQGDPWGLAAERTTTFWNAKRVQGSTPGELGTCPITEAIAESDRRRYHVACPACGHLEPFTWKDPDGTYRLVCDRDATGQLIPETAQYLCRACGVLIPESEKLRMISPARGARWIPDHPGRPVVGFDINGLVSPWRSWATIMRMWVEAQRDPEKLKVFVTHVLAEPYDANRERIEVHTLQARAEPLEQAPEVAGVLGITVDTQKDRVETLTVAWAPKREAFVLAWDQFFGDPATDQPWEDALQHHREASWGVPLEFVGFDAQYLPERAWAAAERWARQLRVRTFALRGMGGPGRKVIDQPTKATDRRKRHPWLVGTDTCKDLLLTHGARVPVPPGGPGALHFASTLDAAFYEQFTAESPVPVRYGGRIAMLWRKRDKLAANEGLDLMVYNLACLTACLTFFGLDVAAAVRRRHAPKAIAAPATPVPIPRPSRQAWVGARRGGRWV